MRSLAGLMALALLGCAGNGTGAGTDPGSDISPKAQALYAMIQGMDVEHHWLKGQAVNWQTGATIPAYDPPHTVPSFETHCSAFTAAVAWKKDIYILRPERPNEFLPLLANSQYVWFRTEGAGKGPGHDGISWTHGGIDDGWRQIPTHGAAAYSQAQAMANADKLVIAIYENPDPEKPGHTSVVVPSAKSDSLVQSEGPDTAQAGEVNSSRISLEQGFKAHVPAFQNGWIRFFYHEIVGD